jgi:polyisoprenyl-teichoic acid--peptidoglycan teichoic acid transferase
LKSFRSETTRPQHAPARQRRLIPTLLAVVSVLTPLALLPDSGVSAATATTKKSAKKSPAKKTTTTKRRKPPAPAKASKKKGEQWSPNGRPPVVALNFDPNPPSGDRTYPSAKNDTEAFLKVQPDNKPLFVLIIGSDARPGEKVDRSRADAIHIVSWNPVLKQGTVIGFPRDTWVATPGGDKRKLSEVLSVSGPEAFLETMNTLTGLSMSRYVITGFDGFKKMVDGVGGINVQVNPAMNDKTSGAQFQAGWFQMNGAAALAFSRARKTLPRGDFDRSANQTKVLIASLQRMRESTDNIRALLNWVYVGRRNTVTNIKAGDWMYLAQVSRAMEPSSLKARVIPATPERVGDQEVVAIDEAEFDTLMSDFADGVLGN